MGLFDKFRGKSAHEGVVYMFTFKVASGQALIPAPMKGAFVVAYSMGDTATVAAERSVNKLRSMGYVVEDMDPKGGEMQLSAWDQQIAERWPDFVDHFPKQKDVLAELERRESILAPFAGFE
jgi:hypothetical protein